jgi:hypothetical protein
MDGSKEQTRRGDASAEECAQLLSFRLARRLELILEGVHHAQVADLAAGGVVITLHTAGCFV